MTEMTNDEDGMFEIIVTIQKVPKTHFLGPKCYFLGLAKSPKTTIKSKVKQNLKKEKHEKITIFFFFFSFLWGSFLIKTNVFWPDWIWHKLTARFQRSFWYMETANHVLSDTSRQKGILIIVPNGLLGELSSQDGNQGNIMFDSLV